jgi:hypothetical protein
MRATNVSRITANVLRRFATLDPLNQPEPVRSGCVMLALPRFCWCPCLQEMRQEQESSRSVVISSL